MTPQDPFHDRTALAIAVVIALGMGLGIWWWWPMGFEGWTLAAIAAAVMIRFLMKSLAKPQ